VVEDEIVTREHLIAILTGAGYDVVAAAKKEAEAANQAKSEFLARVTISS
jgi:CheY-like chemotaxis protein